MLADLKFGLGLNQRQCRQRVLAPRFRAGGSHGKPSYTFSVLPKHRF